MENEIKNQADATVVSAIATKTFSVAGKNATRKDEPNRTVYAISIKSPIKYVNAEEDAITDSRLLYLSWFEIVRVLSEKPGFARIQDMLYGRRADGTIDPSRPSDDVRDIISDATFIISQQEVVAGQIVTDPITGKQENEPCKAHSIRTYLHDLTFGEEGLGVWEEIKQDVAQLAREARRARLMGK